MTDAQSADSGWSGWHVRVAETEGAPGVEIVDPAGISRMRVRPLPGTSELGDAVLWLAIRDTARLVPDSAAELMLPDGTSVVSETAKPRPIRRPAATRTFGLVGRTYELRHTTDRRARVSRDGRAYAALHADWQWGLGRRRCTEDLGFSWTPTGPYDGLDEVVVHACGTALGPPGHEGGITRVLRGGPALLLDLFANSP